MSFPSWLTHLLLLALGLVLGAFWEAWRRRPRVLSPVLDPEREPAEEVPQVLCLRSEKLDGEPLSQALSVRYRAILVREAGKAMAWIEKAVPDLVVVDLPADPKGAVRFVSWLRSLDNEAAQVPLVLLCDPEDSDSNDWLLSGDRELKRPVSIGELARTVETILEVRRQGLDPQFEESTSFPKPTSTDLEDRVFVSKLRKVLDGNLGSGTYSVPDLARDLGMERSTLYRRMRSALALTPSEVIRNVRLRRAAELLESNAGGISEIAYSVGFSSLSHFSRCFRELFGCSPSEYRRPTGDLDGQDEKASV